MIRRHFLSVCYKNKMNRYSTDEDMSEDDDRELSREGVFYQSRQEGPSSTTLSSGSTAVTGGAEFEILSDAETPADCCNRCQKYTDHNGFTAASGFTLVHLPLNCRDDELHRCIKLMSDMTVRLTIRHAGSSRPIAGSSREDNGTARVTRMCTGFFSYFDIRSWASMFESNMIWKQRPTLDYADTADRDRFSDPCDEFDLDRIKEQIVLEMDSEEMKEFVRNFSCERLRHMCLLIWPAVQAYNDSLTYFQRVLSGCMGLCYANLPEELDISVLCHQDVIDQLANSNTLFSDDGLCCSDSISASDHTTTNISDDVTTNISDDKTTNISNDSTTNISDDTMPRMTGDPTSNISDEKTTNISDDTTTNKTDNRAANISDDATANISDDTTTNISDEKTTNISDDKTTNISDDATTNKTDNRAANILYDATTNIPGDTRNISCDAINNKSDDSTANITDDETTNISCYTMPKILRDPTPNISDDETTNISDYATTNISDDATTCISDDAAINMLDDATTNISGDSTANLTGDAIYKISKRTTSSLSDNTTQNTSDEPTASTSADLTATSVDNSTSRCLYSEAVLSPVNPCPCPECKSSLKPQREGYVFDVLIDRRAILGNTEAANTVVDVEFGGELKHLYGQTVQRVSDFCDLQYLRCVTHELQLAEWICDRSVAFGKVYRRVCARISMPLAVICSYPHGHEKMVSVGEWTARFSHDCGQTPPLTYLSYRYTTPTCPGSIGAPVLVFGKIENYGNVLNEVQAHYGTISQDENTSGVGLALRFWPKSA